MNSRDIRTHILTFVGRTRPAAGLNSQLVSDDFDLRRDGAIDSLGFVRLIAELEGRSGKTIDLSDLDPEKLTVLGALASHIASQLGEAR
jgi:acyl carrier protein